MIRVVLASDDSGLIASVDRVTSELGGISLESGPPSTQFDVASPRPALYLVHLADRDGVAGLSTFLAANRRSYVPPPVVVLCEEHDPAVKLQLARLGAAECLSRPLDLGRLRFHLWAAVGRQRCADMSRKSGVSDAWEETVTGSMARVVEQAQRAAPLDATILINGETGVGKTHLAAIIHSWSGRGDQPFLTVNCAAIPETLLESELFGHRSGAFTGADRDQFGTFAQVGRGSLLLDEVDTLPLTAQAKLLRVVDSGEYERLGGSKPERFLGRLLVASNADLEQLVEEDRFRADLYYRLNVLQLTIPPLRERRDEILVLAKTFLRDFAKRNNLPLPMISPEAAAALCSYSWPGNIREVHNVVCRAAAFHQNGTIEWTDLPPEVRECRCPSTQRNGKSSSGLQLGRLHGEFAKLVEALEQNDQNRTQTAAFLGISRAALYKRLQKFGLTS